MRVVDTEHERALADQGVPRRRQERDRVVQRGGDDEIREGTQRHHARRLGADRPPQLDVLQRIDRRSGKRRFADACVADEYDAGYLTAGQRVMNRGELLSPFDARRGCVHRIKHYVSDQHLWRRQLAQDRAGSAAAGAAGARRSDGR